MKHATIDTLTDHATGQTHANIILTETLDAFGNRHGRVHINITPASHARLIALAERHHARTRTYDYRPDFPRVATTYHL